VGRGEGVTQPPKRAPELRRGQVTSHRHPSYVEQPSTLGFEMPTYEYACKACGEHIDVRQSVNDEPLSVCPSCGGTLRKVFGSIGISFKGSGFYRTDSRTPSKESKKAKADASSSSTDGKKDGASDTGKTAESKSDSKSGSTSDSKPKADSGTSSAAPKSDAKSA
jgi:putative FmdB family regulatory protein